MMAIIQDVIFPIMSHTEADQAQWDSDPYEYIRLKFGKFSLSGISHFVKTTRRRGSK